MSEPPKILRVARQWMERAEDEDVEEAVAVARKVRAVVWDQLPSELVEGKGF